MSSALPLFPVTTIGSWPRPPALLTAQRLKLQGRLDPAEFDRLADAATLEALRVQEAAGVDVVTDGEQRRENFFSFVAEKLSGVRLFTLSEMFDIVEDRAAFEHILQELDAPSYAISNAVCVDRVARVRSLAADDLRFARRHTSRPLKVTLPGPYLLTRAMWVPALSGAAYPTKEDLGRDVVQVLRQEIQELVREGAAFIQLDEPVLTELVFTQGRTRTFMCAALAARKDPTEELEFAAWLLASVLDGIDPGATRLGLHVCRGNWSRNEATLLRGGYSPLAQFFDRAGVHQLVLEYATERAGEVLFFEGKELGLGVVNPRTDAIEDPATIAQLAERAAGMYGPERIWLNPDCGFGTFSNRPVNSAETAERKLRAMVAAARRLRGEPAPAD